MKNDFSYRLKNKIGQYYFIDGSTLTTQVDPIELAFTPDGWQEKSVNWKRAVQDLAVLRSFTIPLKFVVDGANMINYLFAIGGYEADCILEICELNNSTNEYEIMYVGEIDFTTYVLGNTSIIVNTIEGGFQKIVKANEDIVYEIPVYDDPEAVDVLMDGVDLKFQAKYEIYDNAVATGGARNVTNMFRVPAISTVNDGTNISLLLSSNIIAERMSIQNTSGHGNGSDPNPYATSNDWLMRPLKDVSVNMHLRLHGTYGSFYTDKFAYKIVLIDETGAETHVLYSGTSSGANGTYYWYIDSLDITVNLLKNKKYFMMFVCFGGAVEFYSSNSNHLTYFSLNLTNTEDPTMCKALLPSTVLKRIAEKMGPSGQSIVNPFLNNPTLNIGLTTLDSFLGLGESSVIKTSLSDFYKFCNTVFGATKYVNGQDQLVVESIKTAFDQTEIIQLGEVENFTMEVWKEVLFNSVKVGYKNQTNDDVNGKLEFNSEQIWSTSVTRSNKQLDMLCPYRADCYGIEAKRIELKGKPTTDSDADNDVFIMHLEDLPTTDWIGAHPYYKLMRRHTLTYGATPTAYNVELSPRWNLVRNWPFLKSILWNTDQTLTLQSGTKNTGIQAIYPGVWTHIENREIKDGNELNPAYPAGSTPDPLFIPIIFKFDCYYTGNIFPVMRNNARGVVEFKYNGVTLKGFVNEINIQPKTEETKSWTLICHPDVDLKTLMALNSLCTGINVAQSDVPYANYNTLYSALIPFTGSVPLQIISTNLPSGLTASVVGNNIKIQGTPAATNPGFVLNMVLSNCAGQHEKGLPLPIYSLQSIPQVIIGTSLAEPDNIHVSQGFSWANSDSNTEIYLYAGVPDSGTERLLSGYPITTSEQTYIAHSLVKDASYFIKVRKASGTEFSQFTINQFTASASSCVPVSIPTNTTVPNGQIGVAYNTQITLQGTSPFVLTSVNKPDWMTAAIVSNKLVLSGTPNAVTDPNYISIYATVTNCSGSMVSYYYEFKITS